VEEQTYQLIFPAVPTLLSLSEGMNQPAKMGSMAYATNGVGIQNPYLKSTCCDNTFNRVSNSDYCNGDSNGGRYAYNLMAMATVKNTFQKL
jgi:hypothetical protein